MIVSQLEIGIILYIMLCDSGKKWDQLLLTPLGL